jgi:hypothetical protein
MKKTMKFALLLGALLAVATCAVGANNPQVVRLPNGAVQYITSPKGPTTPYVEDPSSDPLIFGNLATKDPKGVYSIFGYYAVSGPKSQDPIGLEWDAAAFTPAASATVTKITVAVGYVNSTNNFDVLLSLNADKNGAPGKALKTWKITFHNGQPAEGTCCTVESKAGSIPVSANTQYWIVLSTEADSDIWAGWNLNDSDEIDTRPVAEYFGQQWNVFSTQVPAFAVYGH